MPAHDVFFFGALFFLAGIGLGSIGEAPLALIATFVLLTTLVIIHTSQYLEVELPDIIKRVRYGALALLTPLVIVGVAYHAYTAHRLASERAVLKSARTFTGVVTGTREKDASITLTLRATGPARTNLLITAPRYPAFTPGDIITVEGSAAPLKDLREWRYLQNEKASGRIFFPRITLKSSKPTLRRALHTLHAWSNDTLLHLIPGERGELMGGLLFGGGTAFSLSLTETLKRSGTIHITALSGFNVTIIMNAVAGGLILFMRRKRAVITALGATLLFVLMTGASPSLVRAALMGALVVIAPLLGRIYHPRNAIIFAALAMAIENPNVLAFDIGFQLSFLALIGLSYLKPILDRLMRNENNRARVKDLAATTLSAQIMTAPALLAYFGAVPLIALASNLAILPLIPWTMCLGFVTILASTVPPLGTLVGWITVLPLAAILELARMFARVPVAIQAVLPGWLTLVLYAPLAITIWKYREPKRPT